MRIVAAIRTLTDRDRCGRAVFTFPDMRMMFPDESAKTLSESLGRLVRAGLLERVGKGIYFNPLSRRSHGRLLEEIAAAMRGGEYNYTSLECALSEWGVISQLPMRYLTVMTTGRKGTFRTPYGTIEFTHTKRSTADIVRNTIVMDPPRLRLATAPAAYRDLKRVGRNLHLVDIEELQEHLDMDDPDVARRYRREAAYLEALQPSWASPDISPWTTARACHDIPSPRR